MIILQVFEELDKGPPRTISVLGTVTAISETSIWLWLPVFGSSTAALAGLSRWLRNLQMCGSGIHERLFHRICWLVCCTTLASLRRLEPVLLTDSLDPPGTFLHRNTRYDSKTIVMARILSSGEGLN
jgi:hypothetical protein